MSLSAIYGLHTEQMRDFGQSQAFLLLRPSTRYDLGLSIAEYKLQTPRNSDFSKLYSSNINASLAQLSHPHISEVNHHD
jgi:hypothetical protein